MSLLENYFEITWYLYCLKKLHQFYNLIHCKILFSTNIELLEVGLNSDQFQFSPDNIRTLSRDTVNEN